MTPSPQKTWGAPSWACTVTPDDGEAEGEASTATVETPEDDTPCHAIQYTDTDASIGVRTPAWACGQAPDLRVRIRYDGSFTNSPGARSWLFMQNESYSHTPPRSTTTPAPSPATPTTTPAAPITSTSTFRHHHGEWVHIACNYDSALHNVRERRGGGTDSAQLQPPRPCLGTERVRTTWTAPTRPRFSIGPTRLSSAVYSADAFDQAWTATATPSQWLVSDGFDGHHAGDEAGGDNDGAYRARWWRQEPRRF